MDDHKLKQDILTARKTWIGKFVHPFQPQNQRNKLQVVIASLYQRKSYNQVSVIIQMFNEHVHYYNIVTGQSTECGTAALTPQMGRPRIPLPGLTGRHLITSSSQETERHDDNYDDITGGSGSTGDSGRGTGSDYGFSDVRPFLRQSISPRTKPNMYPIVPPKPTKYMSLTTRNISEDEYTHLRTAYRE